MEELVYTRNETGHKSRLENERNKWRREVGFKKRGKMIFNKK